MNARRYISILLTILTTSLLMVNVNAATISYEQNATLDGFEFSSPGDGGFLSQVDSLSLDEIPMFDPSMGTLMSATISFDGTLFYDASLNGDLVLDETQPNSVDVGFEVGVGVNFAGTLIPSDIIPNFVGCVAPEFSGPCGGGGGDSLDSFAGFTFTTGADLTNFVGTGDLGALELVLLAGLGSSGNFFLDNLDFADLELVVAFDGLVTVDYEYQPVPLPAAIWFLGSALAGLGFMRRR